MGLKGLLAFMETKVIRKILWGIQNRSLVFCNGILTDAGAATGTTSVLRFQSKHMDTNNEYSIANGRFTAKTAGTYEVQVFLYVLGVESGKNILAQIYKNGAVISAGAGVIGLENNAYSTTATLGMTSAKYEIDLAVGDYIDVRARISNASAGASWNSGSTLSIERKKEIL